MQLSLPPRVRFPLLAFGLSIALWVIVAWPLARYASSGIPAAPVNVRQAAPQELIAGDHLQFLYHLWLGHDTWFGPTPWSTNLYEFNTGDDAARRQYSTYYFPFHLFFGLGYEMGGLAFGWNLTAILSIAISLGATVLWLKRWIPNRPMLIWCMALLGQTLPYRWHTLLNGSPTGLSLMWIPLILLGLDIWLRDQKARGAMLAGAGVFFSGWSDHHVFFFGGLLCVFWTPIALLAIHQRRTLDMTLWKRLLISAWPLALFVGLTLYQITRVHKTLEGTETEGGREIEEVALFSPHWKEAVSSKGFGGLAETYLGWGLVAAGGFLLVAMLWRAFKKTDREWASLSVYLILAAVLFGGSLLATGLNNPWGPEGWTRLTRLLPPLGLLRQPAKIYLIFPPLLSMAAALGLAALPRKHDRIAAPLLLLVLAVTFTARVHPHISLLPDANAAYAHVASESDTPRALALPLWPGDSHWSSLYLYHAKQHRIRMVNGYRPSRNIAYVQNIFERFHTLSQGEIHEDLLDELLDRGISFLIVHENAVPERVSPFSIGYTLRALLAHPRIRYEVQDGPVWAFRILPAGETAGRYTPLPKWHSYGAVRWWDIVYGEGNMENLRDPSAFQGRHARLRQTDHFVHAINFHFSLQGDRTLWLRVRGQGQAQLDLTWGDETLHADIVEFNHPDWDWMEIPLPERPGFQTRMTLALQHLAGEIDLDIVHFSHASWSPNLTTPRTIPAPAFFRAGHTDLTSNTVNFHPVTEPHDYIFYGQAAPLARGRYRMTLQHDSEAPDGTEIGTMGIRIGSDAITPVRAGEETILEWDHHEPVLWVMEFKYHGTHPMRIHSLTLEPVTP